MSKWNGLSDEIKKDFIEIYSKKINSLDGILDNLTRNYCQKLCPEDDNVGCCGANHYLAGSSEELFKLQEQEFKGESIQTSQGNCKYHSSDHGCGIKTKSPLCIGYLCMSLEHYLRKFDDKKGLDFIYSLEAIGKSSIVQHDFLLLSLLDKAIEKGKALEDHIFTNGYSKSL